MIVLGVIGGVASGKSLVSKLLSDLGAKVIDADTLGHEVLCEPEVVRAMTGRWGDAVVDRAGQPVRTAIASIVFQPPPDGPREKAFLEQLTHPRIRRRMREKLEQWRREDSADVVVLDAALLLEAGWDEYCDHIIFVDSPEQQRRDRAMQRGWNEYTFAAREAAQFSIAAKRQQADLVVDNGATIEQVQRQVSDLWQKVSQKNP